MDKVARDQLVGLQTEALGPETGSDRWEASAQPAERVAEAIHSQRSLGGPRPDWKSKITPPQPPPLMLPALPGTRNGNGLGMASGDALAR